MPKMTEQEFSDVLKEMLLADQEEHVHDVRTFQEVGVLSNDTGLLVKLDDGAQFYVTIQKK